MLSLELLDKNISECREYVEAGKEDQSTLDFFLTLREDLAGASEADWVAYNELTNHLPDKDADPVLIILKGHLLIERLVRQFITYRLLNPKAFEKCVFNASQCIAIAESMCLENEEPAWLWRQVKDLNSIRNKLAHNLDVENIEQRIKSFVVTFSNAQKLKNQSLTNVIARLYGMVKGLCDLAESKEFSISKRYNVE